MLFFDQITVVLDHWFLHVLKLFLQSNFGTFLTVVKKMRLQQLLCIIL